MKIDRRLRANLGENYVKSSLLFVSAFLLALVTDAYPQADEALASSVMIHRDEWGVPHIYGSTVTSTSPSGVPSSTWMMMGT